MRIEGASEVAPESRRRSFRPNLSPSDHRGTQLVRIGGLLLKRSSQLGPNLRVPGVIPAR